MTTPDLDARLRAIAPSPHLAHMEIVGFCSETDCNLPLYANGTICMCDFGHRYDVSTFEKRNPLEARRDAITEALQDPFMDKVTAFTLLDELGEIETQLQKE